MGDPYEAAVQEPFRTLFILGKALTGLLLFSSKPVFTGSSLLK